LTIKKVHEGLSEVSREEEYHLGHYEIDFQDGPLRFQLHARICAERDCPCDNIRLDWLAGGNRMTTWYTSNQGWLDAEGKPLDDELANVFRIAEKTEAFQERIDHLRFLRRKAVLREIRRSEPPFEVSIPTELLMQGHQMENQVLGVLRLPIDGKERSVPFAIEFCGDSNCFCKRMFLVMMVPRRDEPLTLIIEEDNQVSLADDLPGGRHLLTKIKPRLSASRPFQRLLAHMRAERGFQNYFRYVEGYAKNLAF
jgi:hypothetical protein